MLNLIRLWNDTTVQGSTAEQPARNYPEGTKPVAINFDKGTTQSSFEFEEPPKVIFVKSVTTLEPVDFYDALPTITMTAEENDARLTFAAELKAKNPRFFDGDQLILTGVIYNDSSNTIYVEARKVPYSFIVSLSNKKFPQNSTLYQLNVFLIKYN